MKKKQLALMIIFLLIVGFVGYNTIKHEQKEPHITVILKNNDQEYWRILASGILDAFQQLNVNGEVMGSYDSGQTLAELLEQALKKKPDALIIAPENMDEIKPILEQYESNHIPVLFVDTQEEWDDLTAFIGTENDQLGIKAGELLSSMLQPNDRVLLIGWESSEDTTVSDMRIKGADKTLRDAGIVTIRSDFNMDISTDIATEELRDLENNGIKGIFAANDIIAIEAIKLLKERNINIPVVGADGITEMLQYVEDGTLKGTIAQNPYDMGFYSVETAVKAIKGEDIADKINSNVDIITKDNASNKLHFIQNLFNSDTQINYIWTSSK